MCTFVHFGCVIFALVFCVAISTYQMVHEKYVSFTCSRVHNCNLKFHVSFCHYHFFCKKILPVWGE